MAWYLDTSAFVKLFVAEADTPALRHWATTRTLVANDLLRTEALRAARRLGSGYVLACREALTAVALMPIPTSLFERAAELDASILRSLDALHLASALDLGDDLEGIATYDPRLANGARHYGLLVATPSGTPSGA